MSGKIIEIHCRSGHLDTLLSIAGVSSAKVLSSNQAMHDEEHVSVRLFVKDHNIQSTLDRLQTSLPTEADAVILMTPVDARIGAENELLESDDGQDLATREELFMEISKGTECDQNFIVLALLATVVAAIGISEDNTAVVIGAMVIAPLLGPNLGLALGAALGDKDLIKSAILTNAVGVGLTIGAAALLSLVWPPSLSSNELLSRTVVQPASVVLALASGIAAVMSLTTRLANVLVGVMVAVALVPPATVFGMMIGTQCWPLAGGAALLLVVNVAAVNLSAQLVFLLRGVRPRTWLAKREAREAIWVNIAVWIMLLVISSAMIVKLSS